MRAAPTALLLVVLAVAPYARSLGFPLLGDDRTLAGSAWVQRDVGPISAFTHDFWHGTRHEGSNLYRPVTVLSLAANARVAPSRAGFRGVNVALHALAVLAAWWALRGIFRAREGAEGGNPRGALAAAAGAGIFAAHPLASEAVLMSVGRGETIAAGAGLAAFRLVLDHRRGRREGWRLAAAAVAFALALLAKESAAAWLLLGAAGAFALVRSDESGRGDRRDALRLAAVFVGVFGAYLALRGAAVAGSPLSVPDVDNPLAPLSGPARAANAVLLLGRYGLVALWPATLSVEHGFDQIAPLALVGALPASAALAIAWTALVAWLWRRDRAAAFCAFFPAAAFVVTGNVLFPIGTIFAERLAYLPLVGACGLAGWAVARLPGPRWLPLALAAALAAGAAARTHRRCGDFRDLATLHAATAEASPRAVKALFNLARTRLRQGRGAEAVPLLERAVAIRPDYARARVLLDGARGSPPPDRGGEDEP